MDEVAHDGGAEGHYIAWKEADLDVLIRETQLSTCESSFAGHAHPPSSHRTLVLMIMRQQVPQACDSHERLVVAEFNGAHAGVLASHEIHLGAVHFVLLLINRLKPQTHSLLRRGETGQEA